MKFMCDNLLMNKAIIFPTTRYGDVFSIDNAGLFRQIMVRDLDLHFLPSILKEVSRLEQSLRPQQCTIWGSWAMANQSTKTALSCQLSPWRPPSLGLWHGCAYSWEWFSPSCGISQRDTLRVRGSGSLSSETPISFWGTP